MTWVWILLAASASVTAQRSTGASAQQASIARQRVSIRQQAANLSLRMQPWSDAPPAFEPPVACDPIAADSIDPLIDSAAKTHSLDPKLVRAVIERESAFRPCAVSSKGAQGLMQLMPDTARDLEVADPFDPAQNVRAGTKYLKQLLDRYGGDLAHALAAYNAGPNAVDPAGSLPDIPETRSYVQEILAKLGLKP